MCTLVDTPHFDDNPVHMCVRSYDEKTYRLDDVPSRFSWQRHLRQGVSGFGRGCTQDEYSERDQ